MDRDADFDSVLDDNLACSGRTKNIVKSLLNYNSDSWKILILGSWGLYRRAAYGRWIAIIALSVIFVMSLAASIFRPNGRIQYYEYENSAQLIGGMIASLVLYGVFGFLIYRLIWGVPAKLFFGVLPNDESTIADPPPPSEYVEIGHPD